MRYIGERRCDETSRGTTIHAYRVYIRTLKTESNTIIYLLVSKKADIASGKRDVREIYVKAKTLA